MNVFTVSSPQIEEDPIECSVTPFLRCSQIALKTTVMEFGRFTIDSTG
jgi:hypothetical protein